MRKKMSMLLVTAFVCLSAGAVSAAEEATGVLPATMEKYKMARIKVEALAGTVVAQRAPEIVEEAGKSITAAQEGMKSGSDKLTYESVEKALLLINYAQVIAVERGAEEKTAAAKAELEKLEQRLVDVLAGKEGI